MDYFKGTKTQISPCIVAKVKFALNLTKNKPSNTKTCSYNYWCNVIETFSSQNNLTDMTIDAAKNNYKSLINKKLKS